MVFDGLVMVFCSLHGDTQAQLKQHQGPSGGLNRRVATHGFTFLISEGKHRIVNALVDLDVCELL